jgi:hypothetical protein
MRYHVVPNVRFHILSRKDHLFQGALMRKKLGISLLLTNFHATGQVEGERKALQPGSAITPETVACRERTTLVVKKNGKAL